MPHYDQHLIVNASTETIEGRVDYNPRTQRYRVTHGDRRICFWERIATVRELLRILHPHLSLVAFDPSDN